MFYNCRYNFIGLNLFTYKYMLFFVSLTPETYCFKTNSMIT